ncbi:MAG: hypothetical protein GY755_19565 [Chloroflexi bacterium]|nr:hypothetical protein [Chloroflexota bacterium]
MPILEKFSFNVNVDQVLKAQGADPQIIRKRRPQLVKFAEAALEQGLPLLEPKVIFEELNILSLTHEQLLLENQGKLKGRIIADQLAGAQKVIVILCTIGPKLEEYSLNKVKTDPVAGLAMEGVGSAAVEALANEVCNHFEEKALKENLKTTIPLSPGMIGWTVEEGQTQIFKLLDTEKIGVKLTPSALMLPRKTLSMIIGVGSNIKADGTTCDYCVMNERCQYKHQYTASH